LRLGHRGRLRSSRESGFEQCGTVLHRDLRPNTALSKDYELSSIRRRNLHEAEDANLSDSPAAFLIFNVLVRGTAIRASAILVRSKSEGLTAFAQIGLDGREFGPFRRVSAKSESGQSTPNKTDEVYAPHAPGEVDRSDADCPAATPPLL